jgi:hypothetical protein
MHYCTKLSVVFIIGHTERLYIQHSISIKQAFYEVSFNIVYQLSVIRISKFLDEEKNTSTQQKKIITISITSFGRYLHFLAQF